MKTAFIKLSEPQRQALLVGLNIPDVRAEGFCKAAETAISVYRRFRKRGNVLEPEVKRRLTKMQKTLLDAASVLTDFLHSDAETSEPTRHEVRRQIALRLSGAIPMGMLTGHFDHKGQPAFARFDGTATDLLDLEQAARKALDARSSNRGGRARNHAAHYFVSTLATAYENATLMQPGIGRNTPFFRLVLKSFEFAGHPIADPLSYIRPVLRARRK